MTLCLGDWSRNLVRRGDRILESRDLKSPEGWSRNLLLRGDGGAYRIWHWSAEFDLDNSIDLVDSVDLDNSIDPVNPVDLVNSMGWVMEF